MSITTNVTTTAGFTEDEVLQAMLDFMVKRGNVVPTGTPRFTYADYRYQTSGVSDTTAWLAWSTNT